MGRLVVSNGPSTLGPDLLARCIEDCDEAVGDVALGLRDRPRFCAFEHALDLAGDGDPTVIGDGHGHAKRLVRGPEVTGEEQFASRVELLQDDVPLSPDLLSRRRAGHVGKDENGAVRQGLHGADGGQGSIDRPGPDLARDKSLQRLKHVRWRQGVRTRLELEELVGEHAVFGGRLSVWIRVARLLGDVDSRNRRHRDQGHLLCGVELQIEGPGVGVPAEGYRLPTRRYGALLPRNPLGLKPGRQSLRLKLRIHQVHEVGQSPVGRSQRSQVDIDDLRHAGADNRHGELHVALQGRRHRILIRRHQGGRLVGGSRRSGGRCRPGGGVDLAEG